MNAVADHLEDRAVDALLVGGEDAHGHEAHMGDRGIGDELLHVLLHQRDQRGVDDGDHRQDEARAAHHVGRHREHRQARTAGSRSRPSSAGSPPAPPSPAVGACTCASGSQVWTGHIGILTAKLAKKASHSQRLHPADDLSPASSKVSVRIGGSAAGRISVVPAPVHRHHRDQHQDRAEEACRGRT